MFNFNLEAYFRWLHCYYLFRLDSELSGLANGATRQGKGERLVCAHSYAAMHFFSFTGAKAP